MDLKKWNHLQVTAFDICGIDIENCLEIYRYASLIAGFRCQDCNIDTLQQVINTIKEELENEKDI
jgi:hypothetical protein